MGKDLFSITYFSQKTHAELASPLEILAVFKSTDIPKKVLGYLIHHKDEYNDTYYFQKMKLNKFFKLSLSLLSMPINFFFVGETLAYNYSRSVECEIQNDTFLLVYGSGGGGGGGKPGSLKIKKLNSKLNFKKRELSKAAAAGEDTSLLQAEIKKLKSAIAEMY